MRVRMAVLAVPVSSGAVPCRHASSPAGPSRDSASPRPGRVPDACLHLIQIGRQETENSYGLTAESCNARGKTLPRTLFCLPALRRGAAAFTPRHGEGPFNPASLLYRYSIVTRYDDG